MLADCCSRSGRSTTEDVMRIANKLSIDEAARNVSANQNRATILANAESALEHGDARWANALLSVADRMAPLIDLRRAERLLTR
jgi:hypothetical protein